MNSYCLYKEKNVHRITKCSSPPTSGQKLMGTFSAFDSDIFPIPFGMRTYTVDNDDKGTKTISIEYDPYDRPVGDTFIQFTTYYKYSPGTIPLIIYGKEYPRITLGIPESKTEEASLILYVKKGSDSDSGSSNNNGYKCVNARCEPSSSPSFKTIDQCLLKCSNKDEYRQRFIGEAKRNREELERVTQLRNGVKLPSKPELVLIAKDIILLIIVSVLISLVIEHFTQML